MLKNVVAANIQSHTKTIPEFPQMGITRFYGNNSNDKPVFAKVLDDVVGNAITRPNSHRSIIRRGHEYGEPVITRHGGATLFTCIATGAAAAYAELIRPDCPSVGRYLADKLVPTLVKEFGRYYNSDHGISLNIHQDVDRFLFADTKKSVSFDLLSSVRSDQYVEAFFDSTGKPLKASKEQYTDIVYAPEVA